jgi:hypothetical protein
MYIHTHIHAHMHIYIHTCIHTYVYISIQVQLLLLLCNNQTWENAFSAVIPQRKLAIQNATLRIVAQRAFSAEAHNITEGRPLGATANQRLKPLGPLERGPVGYAFVTNDADHSETPPQVSEN